MHLHVKLCRLHCLHNTIESVLRTLPSLQLPLHVVIDIYKGPRVPNTVQITVPLHLGFDFVSHQPMVELAEIRTITEIRHVETWS
jgi:hypothetical protein